MTLTTTHLTRAAGAAAIAAGVTFIGVQIGHPHLDTDSITTTEMAVRNSIKVLMCGLALVGITGMYLRQVREAGILGFVGWLVFSIGYLTMMGVTFVAATVLPQIAGTDPGYVSDLLAAASNGSAVGDIGLMQTVLIVQGAGFIGGSLLFGVALFRARVLSRWASALLAVGGLITVALSIMPDAFYRLLAFPNAIAMIGLGYSLWASTRSAADADSTTTRPAVSVPASI